MDSLFGSQLCRDEHQVQCQWLSVRGAACRLRAGHHSKHVSEGESPSDGHQVYVSGGWLWFVCLSHTTPPSYHRRNKLLRRQFGMSQRESRTWLSFIYKYSFLLKCLTLLNSCNDVDIITDEGLGNRASGYHPIQKRLAKLNGTQCGFCSPGFVMNMYGLLERQGGRVTMAEVEDAFGGNICRCTGYRPILDAMKSFAVDSNIEVPVECVDIEDSFELLCPRTGQCCSGGCSRPSLRAQNNSRWYWPKTLVELFDALGQVPSGEEYILVAGNTAHGVYRRSKSIQHYVDVNMVPELKQHSIEPEHLLLGANVTLTDAMQVFRQAQQRAGFEYCAQLWQHFNLIANVPVRNVSEP